MQLESAIPEVVVYILHSEARKRAVTRPVRQAVGRDGGGRINYFLKKFETVVYMSGG